MARATGLEPATSGVTGRHSNQLSYARVASRVAAMAAVYGAGPTLSSRLGAQIRTPPRRPAPRPLRSRMHALTHTARGRLAQLVEHLVYTERVGGSSPSPPTSALAGAPRGALLPSLSSGSAPEVSRCLVKAREARRPITRSLASSRLFVTARANEAGKRRGPVRSQRPIRRCRARTRGLPYPLRTHRHRNSALSPLSACNRRQADPVHHRREDGDGGVPSGLSLHISRRSTWAHRSIPSIRRHSMPIISISENPALYGSGISSSLSCACR